MSRESPVPNESHLPIGSQVLSRLDILTCLGLGLLCFALNLTLALVFREYHLLDYGALFQSDPDKWIASLAHGNGLPTFRHPLFMLFFHPLVLVLGWLVSVMTPGSWNAEIIRETFVMLMAPFFSGLKAAALFALFRSMLLPYLGSLLITFLSILSFSQLVFGSIPDHMGVSGSLLTLLFLQGGLALRNASFDRMWIWTILGIAIVGVTVSNAVAFAMVFAGVRLVRREAVRSVIVRTGVFSTLLIASAAIIAFSFSPLFEYTGPYPNFEKTLKFIHASPEEIVTKSARFPLNLSFTLVATNPDVYESPFFQKIGSKYSTVFAIFDRKVNFDLVFRSITALIVVAGGLLNWWYSRSSFRILSLSAAGILLFNWGLHSVWGTGWYFYSQHWHASLMVILAGWLTMKRPFLKFAVWGLALLLCICIVQNVAVMNIILETMAGIVRSP
jgi:hypothetical protein